MCAYVLKSIRAHVLKYALTADWASQNFNNTMTQDIWGHIGEDRAIQTRARPTASLSAPHRPIDHRKIRAPRGCVHPPAQSQ